MPLSALEARIRHADGALIAAGWTDAFVRRVESPGAVLVDDGTVKPPTLTRLELLLCVPAGPGDLPVPAALLDIKAEFLPPDHAVDEATLRADCLRHHVPMAFTTNGHQFSSFDLVGGLVRKPQPIGELPSPGALRARFEQLRDLRLAGDCARALQVADPFGAGMVRAPEDAAMRVILEAVVRGERRILVKVNPAARDEGPALLAARRLVASGTMRRTTIVAANAKRLAALQCGTHGLEGISVIAAEPGATLPAGTDAVLLDECQHSRAWPQQQALLASAPDAVHIAVAGAALHPVDGNDPADAARTEAILAHFGAPRYEYRLGDAVQDGWCGALELVRRDLDGAASSADDLFRQLLAVDGPQQRGIVVCADEDSATAMARELSARYAVWAERMTIERSPVPYARAGTQQDASTILCTAQFPEDLPLDDVRVLALLAPERRTGVLLRAIARASAVAPAHGKLLLRVIDYVGASRVIPEQVRDRYRPVSAAHASAPAADSVKPFSSAGLNIRVSPAGRSALRSDGSLETAASLGRALAVQVVARYPSLAKLRDAWSVRAERRAAQRAFPDLGRWKLLADREEADDFDALAELGFGARPRSRADRADGFAATQARWLGGFQAEVGLVLRAVAKGFAAQGMDAFEDLDILQHPDVERAGGMRALRKGGAPADLVRMVGERIIRT